MNYSKCVGFALVGTVGAVCLFASQPAQAQVEYGKWKKTDECRSARAPVGPGRGAIEIPQVPGVEPANECKWEREVIKCPRLRDKARHPIRCSTGKQKSGYSLWEPKV